LLARAKRVGICSLHMQASPAADPHPPLPPFRGKGKEKVDVTRMKRSDIRDNPSAETLPRIALRCIRPTQLEPLLAKGRSLLLARAKRVGICSLHMQASPAADPHPDLPPFRGKGKTGRA